MCWLAKICDIIFGCFQNSLGRVFTIGGETYIVCCLCGTKFPYSLDTMSVHSDETEDSRPRIVDTRAEYRNAGSRKSG